MRIRLSPVGCRLHGSIQSGELSLILVLRADGVICPLFCLFKKLWRCLHIAKQEPQINEEIRDRELRVIGSDGTQLGIMSAADAQHIADEKNLDLVKIAPQAKPPVCKIMDYGKYRDHGLRQVSL